MLVHEFAETFRRLLVRCFMSLGDGWTHIIVGTRLQMSQKIHECAGPTWSEQENAFPGHSPTEGLPD